MKHKKKKFSSPQLLPGQVVPSASAHALTLETLLKKPDTVLHVHTIDVVRLKDDKAPIQVGEELMFVAKAVVQLMHTSATPAEKGELELVVPGDIFEIGADADLVSEIETESDDAVAEILTSIFKFKFVFKVNGKPVPYAPAEGDPPWVFRFDTSVYPTDFLKVDVDISHENPKVVAPPPPPPPPAPPPPAPVPAPSIVRTFEVRGQQQGSLVLEATLPAPFKAGQYLLPLHNEDPTAPSLWLRVTLEAH